MVLLLSLGKFDMRPKEGGQDLSMGIFLPSDLLSLISMPSSSKRARGTKPNAGP